MIPVVSRVEMRAFDAHAIGACKVPSLVLMENAGRGAAEVIEREALGGRPRGKRVVVVCGTGNNGGDGFVVARRLASRGAIVEAWLVGEAPKTQDCQLNMDAFAGIGGRVGRVDLDGSLGGRRAVLGKADVIVDAIFGTGLDRAIEGPLARLIEVINEMAAVKVALDVPSGMNADTGATMGTAVIADMTVSFAHPKLGHVTPHGARLSGHVHVVDIGVPASLWTARSADLLEARDVRAVLLPRPIDAHKYRAGHVAVLAGSPGKVGAALLCAHGALRGGAGAATIVTWPESATALESRVVEIMTARIHEGSELTDQIDAALVHKRAVVMGPGFGTGDGARAAVNHVLSTFPGTIVADADALSLHARAIEEFSAAGGRAILTPHAGELGRLLGMTSEEIEADRFTAARTAAARAHAVVILKGAHTVIAAPDGRVVVNSTGNAALATAGAGDVLAGLTGALACTLTPFEAAWAAVYLHGASGDAWKEANADRGMTASDIADGLPGVYASLLNVGHARGERA
ncbi:NAD(P)HX epimerase / NAD(P)HX dehydratase [Labilithrix luteola]|uniref:Bifunctional NAD(P)H-hydrate repair enzyme n=1 Tax=Labilithrix luteola TaxID=1391654 RepID=A0A0K1Q276_9BACT|nr:NAD(P)H-hydrate dehydratase [Labilithrix luteola]AKU99910.1 NAD(P)HX epimerase / NAD(P)HX dehydratase [Labilithrix luteola]